MTTQHDSSEASKDNGLNNVQSDHGEISEDQTIQAIPPKDDWGPPWVGARGQRQRIDLALALVTFVLAASATLFFGWRALQAISASAAVTLITHYGFTHLLRLIRSTFQNEHPLHLLTMGVLAALALPASLGLTAFIALGVMTGASALFMGRTRPIRVHPVLLGVLILSTHQTISPWLSPQPYQSSTPMSSPILRPDKIFVGDICQTSAEELPMPWWSLHGQSNTDAIDRPEPHALLLQEQKRSLQHRWRLAHLLSSGNLRPMTEMLIGAVPGPMGTTNPALIILLGLYLMYKRLACAPIVVSVLFSTLVTLLLMPVPYQQGWNTVLSQLLEFGPLIAMTYLGYMVLASPLPFVVMILAPMNTPANRFGRLLFGSLLGSGFVILQWVFATPLAAYISLAIVGSMVPWMERLHRSPFIVRT